MDINIEVVDANNITLVVTPTPTQTITIDRGIAGPQGPAGPAGSVASVSVVSANGLAGTVANPTTTPAITLSTTVTGIAKGDGTALSAAVAGTDYIVPPSGTALLKANSGGALANAVANTDYITPPSGTSLLKAGSGGALANAVSGTDYAPATSGASILYGDSAGGFNNVTVGSGLSFAAGTLAATGGSSGDVIGPASATDKAIVTFDGTTGKLIQNNSGNTIGTTGNTVIEVTDNTNAALRITQLGSGNALLVEDDTNPDASPFVIDALGNVGIGTLTPSIKLNVQANTSLSIVNSISSGATQYRFLRTNGTLASPTIVNSGENLAVVRFEGYDGTNYIQAASITAVIDGTPGTNDMPGRLTFSTTADGASSPTERMRINSSGQVGIGTTPQAGRTFTVEKAITGATGSYAQINAGTIQSDVTTAGYYYSSFASTASAIFTIGQISHYATSGGTTFANVTAGGAVTSQYGFNVGSGLTGATNNYGFYGDIASGTGRWNLYMNGTAANYLGGDTIVNGKIGLGTAASPSYGTAGQVLTSAGSGASPTWDAVSLTTGVSGTLPLANGGTNATSAPAAMASLMGFTSTATAAGTTTLDNTSSYYQIFTGTTTQTIVLPVTSTLVTGWTFHLCNNSTGVLTVNSSGGNLVISIPAGVTAMCTCIGIALTTAADWESGFTDFTTATGTGSVVLGTSPTISASTFTGGYTEAVYNLTGTAFVSANGSIQTKTLSGATTFTNSLTNGQSIVLMLTTGGFVVTWPSITWVTSAGNVAPTLGANSTLVFWQINTTLYGAYVGYY
jgi:hypothetical protein